MQAGWRHPTRSTLTGWARNGNGQAGRPRISFRALSIYTISLIPIGTQSLVILRSTPIGALVGDSELLVCARQNEERCSQYGLSCITVYEHLLSQSQTC
ncbi:LOW QUALITY PROTEIN: uncharacterized protein QC761_0014170 [Podospora bellae-mahoneyi]|uniref:Uncharacterized protein n=1 Tax=Podospora bellae-mahoneyi TaxID=2093777 RepID=A0ABR0FZ54_9PEZI|nr:LOW QUALITY PROTEIN: hypothetical protein QC761_0014170 [Podospora bellae-mahoneyi]